MDFQHVLTLTPRRNKIGGCTASRSTSAGSSPNTEHLSAIDLLHQNSLSTSYPTDVLGLPDYDYPMPWAVEQPPKIPDGDLLLAQLNVKNTFLGTNASRPQSLEEYFAEHHTKSSPGSGISLPPGLEDLVEPEQAAARLVAYESAGRQLDLPESEYLPSGLFDAPLDASAPEFKPCSSLSSGLLDALDTPALFSPPASQLDASAPEFLPDASQGLAEFNAPWTSPAPLLHEQHDLFRLDLMSALCAPVERAPAQLSSSFDAVMAALSATAEPMRAQQLSRGFDAAAPVFEPASMQQTSSFDSAAPAFEPATMQQSSDYHAATAPFEPAMTFSNTLFSTAAPVPAVSQQALAECPTVGSKDHWTGNCRPCAFLYTKGCENGISCSFCHICEPGEKKRRARQARASQRLMNNNTVVDAVVSLESLAR